MLQNKSIENRNNGTLRKHFIEKGIKIGQYSFDLNYIWSV